MAECEGNGEFKFLSIDAAYKPCMRLLGQAPHGAPMAEHAAQALPDGDAVHAVVTVRGLTGAVVGVAPSPCTLHCNDHAA